MLGRESKQWQGKEYSEHSYALYQQKLLYMVASISDPNHAAITANLISHVRRFAESGGDINFINMDDDKGLLWLTLEKGVIPMLQVLSELGADMDMPIHGLHPIVYAYLHKKDFVLPLIQSGSGTGVDNKMKRQIIDDVRARAGEDDADHLSQLLFAGSELAHKKEHVLYDFSKVSSEFNIEKNDARKHFLKLLQQNGAYRRYAITPKPDVLNDLYERFPNFHPVLEHMKRQISLARLSDRSIFTMSPILLHGAPGIGKTRFCREVASVMEYEFWKINCGSVTASWVISGSSTSWQEGRPGMVHTSMRDGETGNPIIMLDEIDKLQGDSRFNAFGPLYELLEDTTAREFTDEAVNIPIDCSRVTWIATANDISLIPNAILSRMKLIEIEAPNKDQIRATIASIMSDILDENSDSWGSKFNASMPDDVIELLSNQSPRDIRNMIRDAMGEAAATRKEEIYTLETKDFVAMRPRSRKIGF